MTSRRCLTTRTWAAALTVALCFGANDTLTAAPPADPGQSIDDALLDDLDNELLDGIGDMKDSPPKKKPAEPGDKSDTEPLPGEDVDWPSAETDPLGYISREMQLVEQLISERGKRSGAEQLQDRIIEDLAKLIEQAEQQQAQQQSNSQNQQQQQTAKRQSVQQPKSAGASSSGQESNQPASDSSDRLGHAEAARPDPELLRGLMKDAWGHLPQREREQMMQMSPERFLPQYELMIERYYRRLAEERSQ